MCKCSDVNTVLSSDGRTCQGIAIRLHSRDGQRYRSILLNYIIQPVFFVDLHPCLHQPNPCASPELIQLDGFTSGFCQTQTGNMEYSCSCPDGYSFDLKTRVCRGTALEIFPAHLLVQICKLFKISTKRKQVLVVVKTFASINFWIVTE